MPTDRPLRQRMPTRLRPTTYRNKSRDDEEPHQVDDAERTIPIQEIRDPDREAPNAHQDDDHHGTIGVQNIRLGEERTTKDVDDHAE